MEFDFPLNDVTMICITQVATQINLLTNRMEKSLERIFLDRLFIFFKVKRADEVNHRRILKNVSSY